MKGLKAFKLLLFLFSSVLLQSQNIDKIKIESEKESFILTTLVDNLNHPWSISILPGAEGILITERSGKLFLYKENKLNNIIGLPKISSGGQGGLLDIIYDNNFLINKTIYFTYTEEVDGLFGTVVAKSLLEELKLNNLEVIFRAEPKSKSTIHFGSRILQGSDGYLYVTLGERGVMDNAQNLKNHGGSIIRIDTEGNTPKDNPFINKDGYLPEIFSYGHRNPQGISLNKVTGEVWIHEHGPKGGDEINIIKKGANYGWPIITYGINYNGTLITKETSRPGLEQPILYWVPSIAPSGMTFYYSNLFPNWSGNLFVGALAGKHLRRLEISGSTITHQEILLKNKIGRIRDVRTGPDGGIYIITDEERGALYKLMPN